MKRTVTALAIILWSCGISRAWSSSEQNAVYKGIQALWKDGVVISSQPAADGVFHIPATGYVLIDNVIPENFTLTFKMEGAMMPGVAFRADESLQSYEYIYFRVYPGAEPEEKIQYIPTFNGEMSWQLYNYPRFEREAEVAENAPFSVRLDVVKDKAALYLNGSEKPALVIDPLLTDRQNGQLFFTSISKALTVSDMRIQSLHENFEMPSPRYRGEQRPGTLLHWQLSQQFECANSSFIYQCVNNVKNDAEQMLSVAANDEGIVNLSRYFKVPGRWVGAKTYIESNGRDQVLLEYDYTHEVAIFLNNAPIFTGKEIDRENGNFGRVIPGEEKITLELAEGTNELSFYVHGDEEMAKYYNAERLGRYQARNWGFTARIAPL